MRSRCMWSKHYPGAGRVAVIVLNKYFADSCQGVVFGRWDILSIKVKVKVTTGTSIAPPLSQPGTRRRWVVSATPPPFYAWSGLHGKS